MRLPRTDENGPIRGIPKSVGCRVVRTGEPVILRRSRLPSPLEPHTFWYSLAAPPVPVPVGLAHDLVDAVAVGPRRGDTLDAGLAVVKSQLLASRARRHASPSTASSSIWPPRSDTGQSLACAGSLPASALRTTARCRAVSATRTGGSPGRRGPSRTQNATPTSARTAATWMAARS